MANSSTRYGTKHNGTKDTTKTKQQRIPLLLLHTSTQSTFRVSPPQEPCVLFDSVWQAGRAARAVLAEWPHPAT